MSEPWMSTPWMSLGVAEHRCHCLCHCLLYCRVRHGAHWMSLVLAGIAGYRLDVAWISKTMDVDVTATLQKNTWVYGVKVLSFWGLVFFVPSLCHPLLLERVPSPTDAPPPPPACDPLQCGRLPTNAWQPRAGRARPPRRAGRRPGQWLPPTSVTPSACRSLSCLCPHSSRRPIRKLQRAQHGGRRCWRSPRQGALSGMKQHAYLSVGFRNSVPGVYTSSETTATPWCPSGVDDERLMDEGYG